MPSAEDIQTYIDQALNFVRTRIEAASFLPSGQKEMHGLILGSGLGGLADRVTGALNIAFSDIPNFPVSTVKGHSGRLLFGQLGEIPVAVLSGRVHLYEGYEPWQTGFAVRLLNALGIKTLFISNAAGALHTGLDPGDLMLITDHINFTGESPLAGPHHPAWGERFVDMSTPYDPKLCEAMRNAAADCGIDLKAGVYLAAKGPNYETAAEVRMMHTLGGDAVGMSTVPEAIVAAQCNLPVCALSLITNYGTGLSAPGEGESAP